jgi:hypothetical protein
MISYFHPSRSGEILIRPADFSSIRRDKARCMRAPSVSPLPKATQPGRNRRQRLRCHGGLHGPTQFSASLDSPRSCSIHASTTHRPSQSNPPNHRHCHHCWANSSQCHQAGIFVRASEPFGESDGGEGIVVSLVTNSHLETRHICTLRNNTVNSFSLPK